MKGDINCKGIEENTLSHRVLVSALARLAEPVAAADSPTDAGVREELQGG